MKKEDIPKFVSEVIATGAPMCAVGHDIYLICETEVPDSRVEQVASEVQAICDRFGSREHLQRNIAAHLRSIGRYFDLPGQGNVSGVSIPPPPPTSLVGNLSKRPTFKEQ